MPPPILSTLRLPVVAAPMFLVSGPELVIAASESGVIGSFPTPNCRSTDDLDAWMGRISDTLDPQSLPWAVNLITHSSNRRLADDLRLIEEYRPAVVITALGSPKPVMETVKAYGGLVIADVINLKLARKATEAGVDGLACVSAGAGGHTGHLSPFAFVRAVRDFFDGIVIVGGGIADGSALAGAIACGADLAYVGTRFLAASESLASADYKQMVIDNDADNLIVSAAVTGTPASWLSPSFLAAGYDPNSQKPPSRNYDSKPDSHQRWKDIWAAGQGLGAIRAVEPVHVVIDRMAAEYTEAVRRLSKHSTLTSTPHR